MNTEKRQLNQPIKTQNAMNISISSLLTKYGIFIAFVAIVIILSIASDNFLTTNNVLNILRQTSIIGIISIGMTFVILIGGIDLSVGSLVALTSVVAATFATIDMGLPWIVPLIVGIAVGGLSGFVNGIVIAKWNLAPFVVTLGMMTSAKGVALVYSEGRPIINLNENFSKIGGSTIIGIPTPIIIFLIVIVISTFILNYTKFGRYIYATGGNEEAAKLSGINTTLIKLSAYTIAGLCAGLASVILSSRLMSGSPILGTGYELDAIAAVVIGGTSLFGGVGTILGTVIGVLIIGVINNGLDLLNVSSYYQQILKGIIIVLAVLLDRKKNN